MRHRLTIALALLGVAAQAADRPNIVLFYADDLGYTDLSCQGSTYYETPNIDRIGREGMTFTHAYAGAANCAPSRACLMTGAYTPRHGVYTVGNSDRGKAAHRKLIPTKNTKILDSKFTTIGEALQANGYQTCVAGKWHLSEDPTKDGFHANFGGTTWGHPKSYFSPYRNPYLKDGPKGEHLPARLANDVGQWIEENAEKPFFAYVPYYSVHTPIQARKDLTATFKAKKGDKSHNDPAYAGMIAAMDLAVGHILDTLDRLEIADRTLVIFTSDNGPHGAVSNAAPLRGSKGMFYEGGIREPFLVRYPPLVKAGTTNDTPIHQVDLYPTFLALTETPTPSTHLLDGVNLLPAFSGKSLPGRALYWHFPAYLQGYGKDLGSPFRNFRTTPCSVVREGEWKLIEYLEDKRLELYHLRNDPSEKENLAEKNPEEAKRMFRMLDEWRKSVDAPVPTEKNPAYREE